MTPLWTTVTTITITPAKTITITRTCTAVTEVLISTFTCGTSGIAQAIITTRTVRDIASTLMTAPDTIVAILTDTLSVSMAGLAPVLTAQQV